MIRNLAVATNCTWALFQDVLNGDLASYPAHRYECLQYGSIPAPGTAAPRAPQTAAQMTDGTWSPEDSLNRGRDYAAATNAKIEAAIADGSYNPSGNLPVDATWLDQYKWPLIAAAAGIGTLVLLGVVKR
jgi:hypothetical protein